MRVSLALTDNITPLLHSWPASMISSFSAQRLARRSAVENLPLVAEVVRLRPGKPISGEIGYGRLSSAARLRGRGLLIPLLLVLLSGCGKPEPITRYQVPKEERLATAAGGHEATGPNRRMLGAIVLSPPKAWFFKIIGTEEAVGQAGRIGLFKEFIQSVKFVGEGEAAVPEWTLPEGWRREPGSAFRYATIQIGDEKQPLELSVSSLALPEGDPDPYILSNINRWRGQLELEPQVQIEPNEGVTRLKLAGGEAVTWVSFVSQSASGGAGHPPPGQGRSPDDAGPDDAGKASQPTSPLTYETPDGWIPGRIGGLRKAAFEIAAEGQHAEMTVIDLAPAAAELLPNINRWRGQIQLDKMTQAQLDEQLQKIEVDGNQGQYIDLVGPADAKPRQAMLGVIALAEGRAWFFKLKGDAKLVAQEKNRFEDFVRSLRFTKQ